MALILWVCFNALLCYHEPWKLFKGDIKDALRQIEPHLLLPYLFEGFLQVSDVEIHLSALDKHVIHVAFHVPVDLVFKHLVDELLIGGTCIFQIKWHYFMTIQIFVGDECHFFLVFEYHLDLIVSRKGVHKVRSLFPEVASTSWLNLGNRKLSFG